MKIAISQSNYLPWRGYFDLIKNVDEFIFFDEVQYTRRDWRNRNLIRMNNEKKWLTIPVSSKGNYNETISQIKINKINWKKSHLNLIKECYRKSSHFHETYEFLDDCFNDIETIFLSEINIFLIKKICDFLKIKTTFLNSNKINKQTKNQSASSRLLEISLNRKAKIYYTGPAAKNYLDTILFKKKNIEINWFDYGKTKIYKQPFKDFYQDLSIVDCLMNCGKDTKKFLNY